MLRNRIRELRLEAKLSMTELAAMTQIRKPDLSRLERGQLPFYPSYRQRIAKALNVAEIDLLMKEDADDNDGPDRVGA